LKKIIFTAIALLVTTISMAAEKLVFTSQLDLGSKMEIKTDYTSDSVDIEQGITIGAEYALDKNWGFGAKYQIERSKLSSIPIYAYAVTDGQKAGIKGAIGYNIMNISGSPYTVSGGLYIAAGVFVKLSPAIDLTAGFENHGASIDIYGEKINLSNPVVSLGLSVKI
jgi:hypothetical protein